MMKIILPPPLMTPPPAQSFARDFALLMRNQLRVMWNKLRQRSLAALIGFALLLILVLSLLVSLGYLAYGALESMPLPIAGLFLSLLFMGGLAGQVFFGVTAAFAAFYMSEDLEMLFMAPVPLKVVFAVKFVSVLASNLVIALLFVFLPGIFGGLLFQAAIPFYFLVFLVGMGLWIAGTAMAGLLNLLVMRIVPPHRSKEAIGFIGALTGILIALVFQLPNMLLNNGGNIDLNAVLVGQEQWLGFMNYLPWGWGSLALIHGISGKFLTGLGLSALLLALGLFLFGLAFALLERGFRRGFIALSQGEGGRRRKVRTVVAEKAVQPERISLTWRHETAPVASLWNGAWAVAKKDLLMFKRDTREWFNLLAPLILMAFFIVQFLITRSDATRSSLIIVLVMYTIMFSGNMALRSFGREGESDWLLNTVPLAGWPVVWGKLISAVLPTLVLMEALVVGTAWAVGLSLNFVLALIPSVLVLSLGSSAIGLYYSINNCRYNPDNPQTRISPGASMLMFLINLVFLLFLGLGFCYLFPPVELVAALKDMPPVTYTGGFLSALISGFYLLSRPLFWPAAGRILIGIVLSAGVWSLVFFGFVAATVRQSRKGFRVEMVTTVKRKNKRQSKLKR